MSEDKTFKHFVIYRTGKLYELNMVSNTLKEAKIPFFTREETSTGLKLAMPAAPVMGPGTFFTIIISEQDIEKVGAILDSLPIERKTNPEVWDFSPKQKVRSTWRIYILITLGISLVIWIISFLR
jgi:hypothetical protein